MTYFVVLMGKTNSEKSSKAKLERLWKHALKKKVCFVGGCNIAKVPCEHLDRFLEYGPSQFSPKPNVKTTSDIDDFSFGFERQKSAVEGVWSFYKKIKGFGLANDQILILI